MVVIMISSAWVSAISFSRPALTVSGPPITAEPESPPSSASSAGVKLCRAASSGVGRRLGIPARRRAIESFDGPAR